MPREIYYADAIREALAQAMREDPSVYVFGEDVAAYGGVFGVTMGLFAEFGHQRVRNTPLSEAAILGEAVGAAVYGMRPVPEIQFGDFITSAMSQVVDLMANYHYRNGTALPITVRLPSGGMLGIGNFHSNCWENWFVHVPGLKVVVPATAYDAKGLLLAAIRDPNPVLYFEQKRLYRLVKDEVPEAAYEVELGKARLALEGKDLTILTYGNMVIEALKASHELNKRGIKAEVVDLRSLVPLDKETIFTSVRKTNRVLILHEARKVAGFGGELAALITEEAFDELAAPIMRLGAKSMPVPMNPNLEAFYLPSIQDVVAAGERLMKY